MSPVPSLADDHAEIRNLLAAYCVLLDLDDMDRWIELFTDDAVYEVYGARGVGHDGIRTLLTGAPGGLHLGGPPMIDVHGDRASTVRNLLFVDRTDGSHRHAVYHDELVRTPEGWRIARCRCRFHGSSGLVDRPPRASS